MDESHNTGENLLDANQPVFSLAGVHLDDAIAEQVVLQAREHLPSGAGEAKYSTLSKSRRGQDALLRIFAELPDRSVRAFVVHKNYMTVAKLVDTLVVELFHDNGYNMYADGSALGMANLVFQVGPVFGSRDKYEKVLRLFVDSVRTKSRASVDEFFDAITAYANTVSEDGFIDIVRLFEMARTQVEDLIQLIESGAIKDGLDPAIPSLKCLCDDIAARIGRFVLIHDQSRAVKNNVHHLLTLEMLPDPARPGKYMEPLPVEEIKFADSKTTPQLQVADWAAGATRQWAAGCAANGPEDAFTKSLTSVVEEWLVDAIWPNPDFISNPRRID